MLNFSGIFYTWKGSDIVNIKIRIRRSTESYLLKFFVKRYMSCLEDLQITRNQKTWLASVKAIG